MENDHLIIGLLHFHDWRNQSCTSLFFKKKKNLFYFFTSKSFIIYYFLHYKTNRQLNKLIYCIDGLLALNLQIFEEEEQRLSFEIESICTNQRCWLKHKLEIKQAHFLAFVINIFFFKNYLKVIFNTDKFLNKFKIF